MTEEDAPVPTIRAVVTGALLLGALLAGCTAGGTAGGTAGPARPTVPDGWTTHEVGDVTFTTPAGWRTEESDGALVVRSGEDATDPAASVVLVPEPRPLRAEADAVLASVVAVMGAQKVADEPVDLPGAREALQLEYVGEQPVDDGTTVTTRARWLFALREDGTGVIAAVNAPDAEFDADLEAVLASVVLP